MSSRKGLIAARFTAALGLLLLLGSAVSCSTRFACCAGRLSADLARGGLTLQFAAGPRTFGRGTLSERLWREPVVVRPHMQVGSGAVWGIRSRYSSLIPLYAWPAPGIHLLIPLWIPILACVAVAVILHLRASRPMPSGCCQTCGYDLTGNTTGRCPECGRDAAPESSGGPRLR